MFSSIPSFRFPSSLHLYRTLLVPLFQPSFSCLIPLIHLPKSSHPPLLLSSSSRSLLSLLSYISIFRIVFLLLLSWLSSVLALSPSFAFSSSPFPCPFFTLNTCPPFLLDVLINVIFRMSFHPFSFSVFNLSWNFYSFAFVLYSHSSSTQTC